MKLDREQAEIIMTALNNYRGELYINNNDINTLGKISNLIKEIEDTMESKDVGQKKIPVTEEMYTAIEVGSETGIEEDYNNHIPRQKCEVCDD